jgi:hypothetical protein
VRILDKLAELAQVARRLDANGGQLDNVST